MYTFAVTLLLGLALFKIVDLVEDLVPGLAKLHNAVTVALGVVGVLALDYSLFEGFEVAGKVKKTFLRGELIVDGERWLGREGMGEFLKRGESGRL